MHLLLDCGDPLQPKTVSAIRMVASVPLKRIIENPRAL
jgi:hypothetical protein